MKGGWTFLSHFLRFYTTNLIIALKLLMEAYVMLISLSVACCTGLDRTVARHKCLLKEVKKLWIGLSSIICK